MNSYLKRKYIRFFESSKILKVKYLLHRLFKEKDIGNLELNFDVLSSIPEDLVLSFGSENEVMEHLFQNGYTSAKGQGSWATSITCNDAPSIVPELFTEVDQPYNAPGIYNTIDTWG